MKSSALAREVSFPMRSLAKAATQTLATVILFLKPHSSVSFFLSIFVCDRLILYFFTDLVCYWGSGLISFPAHCYGNRSQKPNTVFLSKSGNRAARCSWIMKRRLSQEAGQRPQPVCSSKMTCITTSSEESLIGRVIPHFGFGTENT